MSDIIVELEGWLKEQGYVLIMNSKYGPGERYEVRFRPPHEEPAPPPLGIHVSDGVGATTKMG